MKPQPGFCYTEKDRVVVNTEKRPDKNCSIYFICMGMNRLGEPDMQFSEELYAKALSEWDDSCYVVENAEQMEDIPELADTRQEACYVYMEHSNNMEYLEFGQPVHFDITGEKTVKITEIR